MKLRERSRIVLLKNVCRGVSRKGTLSMKDGRPEDFSNISKNALSPRGPEAHERFRKKFISTSHRF